MSPDSLPKFERPPVVETVLGVQFEPVSKFHNAHLGAFWKRLGADWTQVNDAPLLSPQFEQFGEQVWSLAGLVNLRLSQDLSNRIQIRNAKQDRMIQVQNGRFHYNWLKQGEEGYPHYDTVRPEFDRSFADFKRFLLDENLGELRPNQWEVTYINHIPIQTVWKEPSDWAKWFKPLAQAQANIGFLHLNSFGGEWHYEIDPQQGRLHVQFQHGRANSPDGPEVVVLTLTARGPININTQDIDLGLDKGLHLGHETIVKTFKELTSVEAHRYWEYINERA